MLNLNRARTMVCTTASLFVLCGCQGYGAESSDANGDDDEDVAEVAQAITFTTLPVSVSYTTGHVNKNEQKYYNFSMTQGKSYTVTMVPGYSNNDPDLYTSNSSNISLNNYQCRPFLGAGKTETCNFAAPFTGTNYVMINGFTDAWYGVRVTSP